MNRFILNSIFLILLSYHPIKNGFAYEKENEIVSKEFIPDLTNGDNWEWPENKNELGRYGFYNLGPTGLMGFMVGGFRGSHIEVALVLPNSPSSDKIKVGDVIIGINGIAFKKNDDLREVFGSAINESEKESNHGYLNLLIWRDKNWLKRNQKEGITFTSIDELLNPDDGEEAFDLALDIEDQPINQEKTEEIKSNGKVYNIVLKLPVLGEYSETSPYNCPKSNHIIDRGLKVIRQKAEKGLGLRYLRGHALLASGDAEHIKFLKDYVFKNKEFQPQRKINPYAYPNGTWHLTYQGLFAAEYYFVTNENHILLPLRNIISALAKGQTHSGMWGDQLTSHPLDYGALFSRPSGKGIVNQISGSAFLALVLAKKAGVFDEYSDYAIEHAIKNYASISGHGSLDSIAQKVVDTYDIDGNNGAPAFAFKFLNNINHAKYFAMVSAVIARNKDSKKNFAVGSEQATLWSTLSTSLLGKKAVQSYHRKHRNWYALARMHDGSWIHQLPNGGLTCKADPTSMYLLQYLCIREKTHLTGKEKNEHLILNDHQFKDLKFNTLKVKGIINKLKNISLSECLDYFDTFSPVLRSLLCVEYGIKYNAKNLNEVPAAIIEFIREGTERQKACAILALSQCGESVIKKHLPLLINQLSNNSDLVIISTIKALAKHYKNLEPLVITPLLKLVTHKKFSNLSNDLNSIPYHVFSILFPESPDNSLFAQDPFNQALPARLVSDALERGFMLDPGKEKLLRYARNWKQSTIGKMAGYIVYATETLPMNDIGRTEVILGYGKEVLKKNNYIDILLETSINGLIESASMAKNTDLSKVAQYKTFIDANTIKLYSSYGRSILPHLERLFKSDPTLSFTEPLKENKIFLFNIIRDIKKQSHNNNTRSLSTAVEDLFNQKLTLLEDKDKKIAFCISQLDLNKKTYFKQRIAMNKLVELNGLNALKNILPFLNHLNWRVREHAHKMICAFGYQASDILIQHSMTIKNEENIDGILKCITTIADPNCAMTALQFFLQNKGTIRSHAVQALFATSQLTHFNTVLSMFKTCDDSIEFEGYEKAFTRLKGNNEQEDIVCNALIPLVKNSRDNMRMSIYSILSKFGRPSDLEFLKQQLYNSDTRKSLMALNAIAQSDDTKSTVTILDFMKFHEGTLISFDAAEIAIKRIPLMIDEKGKFIEPAIVGFISEILNIVNHKKLILLLGNIVSLESIQCLNKCLNSRSDVTRFATTRAIILFCERLKLNSGAVNPAIKKELLLALRRLEVINLPSNLNHILEIEKTYQYLNKKL